MNDKLKATGGMLLCTWSGLWIRNVLKPNELAIKLFLINSTLIILLMLYSRIKK